jgi:hypothetical protein
MAVLYSDQTTAGYRQDLLDEIQMVSPSATPIFTRLADVQGSSTVHEWVEDTLATADCGERFLKVRRLRLLRP